MLGLSGCTPAEILGVQPTFIEMLGLKQSLTPSRNNGFLNMFLKMQKLTLGLMVGGVDALCAVLCCAGACCWVAAEGAPSDSVTSNMQLLAHPLH